MTDLSRIPSSVARKLNYYIYAYVNPANRRIFYVGKGKGQRALSHLRDRSKSEKAATIRELAAAGKKPEIHILAHGIKDEKTALRIEAAVIDAIGITSLTNRVRGWNAIEFGRTPLPELVAHIKQEPVRIQEPAILIRINREYRPTMTPTELYDATRASWKVGPQRDKAKYAFAVFEGIIREVYTIEQWLPAGSTFNNRFPHGDRRKDRWEFVGRLADDKVRVRYVNRSVGDRFAYGAQNPIAYVNVH